MPRTRTTIVMQESVLKAAKRAALEKDQSLSDLIEEAVQRMLGSDLGPRPPLPVLKGGLLAGVDLENKEQMEELGGLWP